MKKHITIFVASPQGGSGKTTIAVNMAIQLAEKHKVLLIDLAIYGSLPAVLKIPIQGKGMSSIITAIEQQEDYSNETIISEHFKDALITYEHNHKLHILLSGSPIKMEKLSEVQTSWLLKVAAKQDYDYIIVDSSSELCERNIAGLEWADHILIPTLQDVSAGWKLILFKEILDNLGIDQKRISIIVNRCTKYSGFVNEELEKELGYAISGEINDFNKIAQKAINYGIPLVRLGKRKVSVAFHKLADNVTEVIRNHEYRRDHP